MATTVYEPYDTSKCTCVNNGLQRTVNLGCPVGYTGSRYETQEWTCTPDFLGSHWKSLGITDTCVCISGTEYRTVRCGPGLSGDRIQKREKVCGDPITFSPWINHDTSACVTCDTSVFEEQTLACSPVEPGKSRIERRYRVCPSGWGPWTLHSSTCSTCTADIIEVDVGCPAGETGDWVQFHKKDCATGSYNYFSDKIKTCVKACTPVDDFEWDAGCPAGHTGKNIQRADMVCDASGNLVVSGTPVTILYTCVPTSYTWKAKGSSVSQTNPGNGFRAGTSCSPQGATGQCHVLISGGGGLADNFNNCECQ